jgi:hypothetical protein
MPADQIDFVDQAEREIFARFKMGEDVRDFLQSDVGRYLHGRAKQQLEESKVDALDVDPDGWRSFFVRRKLRQIRLRAEVARSFMKWCADAIIDGNHAARELDEYREK